MHKSCKFLNSKGQSTVEYLLLLLVVSLFGYTVFKGSLGKYIGEESDFVESMKRKMIFSYTHGYGSSQNVGAPTDEKHKSYFKEGGGSGGSRFFTSEQAY